MKKVLYLLASIIVIVSCEKLNRHESPAGVISGSAQKGYLVKDSKVTAYAYGSNMKQTGQTFSASITGCLGAFSINVENADADYFELKAEGYYFDEVTGNITDSPICLSAFVASSEAKVNLNIFTTITKDRIMKLVSSGTSYKKAKVQAQEEFLKTVNLIGADIDFTKLDLTGGSDADALLLTTTCLIQNGRSASELSVVVEKAASEFKDNGKISEKTAEEIFQPQDLDFETVFDNLRKYYDENGLSKDDLPSYWRYFYLDENETMAFISHEGFNTSYTELKSPEAASGTYKIVSLEPFSVSTDVDWITFEKRELEKEVFELKVFIAENKAYEQREGHLFLCDAKSNVLRNLEYIQGPVINPKASLIGEGTIENPFLIECLDDLIYMRDVFNKNNISDQLITSRTDGSRVYASGAVFQLTSDIDLSPVCGPDKGDWTPIGILQGNDIHNNTSGFNGTFICSKTDNNGGLLTNSPGYTISGLYINNDTDYQGLFGVFKGKVCDLNIDGDVSGGDYVGLFAGYVGTDHITNIETRGKVSGEDVAGGIAGSFEGMINDCTNYADVTSNNSHMNSIGGITGLSTGTIDQCSNHGTIGDSYYSGGIVGKGRNTHIFDCSNYGNISGEVAGGIVGNIEGVINSCTNNADVTATTLGGGIAASSEGGTINHSKNYGLIISGRAAGGIVAMSSSYDNVLYMCDCSNYGNVSAVQIVGGIIGEVYNRTKEQRDSFGIVNCCNNGNLHLTLNHDHFYPSAGGIIGSVMNYLIKNCYSTGVISYEGKNSTKAIGGVCGYLIKSSSIKVEHNYYKQEGILATGGERSDGGYDDNVIENCFCLTQAQMMGLEPYEGVLYKSEDGKSFNTLLESLNAFKIDSNPNGLHGQYIWEYSSKEPYPVLSESRYY